MQPLRSPSSPLPPRDPPLSLHYPARLVFPGQPEPPPFFIEVFDWRSSAWRTLPPTGNTTVRYFYAEAPLAESEVNAGLVRIRRRDTAGKSGDLRASRGSS